MARPAVVIALPPDEVVPVSMELHAAGLETIPVESPVELEALLRSRRDIAVAIIDAETDFDSSLEYYGLLHENGLHVPALMIVSGEELDQLAPGRSHTSIDDEFFTRPYSPESIRWRVEAMCIRSQTVDDGTGPVMVSGSADSSDWVRRATTVAVFNPKGGVGKTTIATNLAAALQVRKRQSVLLVDADTVTGHVATSLRIEQLRTVVDAFRDEADGETPEPFAELAAAHPSGLRVIALASSPLHTDILDPQRVAAGIQQAGRGFDFVVVDVHPSYSSLNKAIFAIADRILVPVTPDVPALRAAVQLREIADELGIRERLAMVVNRANSGVSVADMERTVGMPALALIRSGGLLLVRASNEGRTVIDVYPKERITEDFDALADRLLPNQPSRAPAPTPARPGFRLFGRREQPVRA
jgi:MinD-like ATPase involved in chromosome partitioning or flagellar assembly